MYGGPRRASCDVCADMYVFVGVYGHHGFVIAVDCMAAVSDGMKNYEVRFEIRVGDPRQHVPLVSPRQMSRSTMQTGVGTQS